mmetsp:Transcript_93606/g.172072  ORF Transcript_93606/g.172072 Transcript_93606/m.172072 type:complete len:108 (-) Transcript_93606:7-330(-)
MLRSMSCSLLLQDARLWRCQSKGKLPSCEAILKNFMAALNRMWQSWNFKPQVGSGKSPHPLTGQVTGTRCEMTSYDQKLTQPKAPAGAPTAKLQNPAAAGGSWGGGR